MAVRRRSVQPDVVIDTQTYGRIPMVSDQAYLEAVLAAAQTVALAGGVLSVIVERHPTDVPQEMVTTAALIEWKDRTDARPQPEPATPLRDRIDELEPDTAPEPGGPVEHLPFAAELESERELVPAGGVEDGLDERDLDDEDVSAIPESRR